MVLVISQIFSELSKFEFHLFLQQSAVHVPLPLSMLAAPAWVLFRIDLVYNGGNFGDGF